MGPGHSRSGDITRRELSLFDVSVPLAFDRASESKVGVFYTKLGERTGNNDHVVVRILNKNKQNLTMYSVKLFR